METKKNKMELIQSCVSVSVTDMRIGNLFELTFIPERSEYLKLTEITKVFENEYGFSFEKNQFRLLDLIFIIPITEELLLKIGAIKLDFKDFPSFNLFGTQINFINGLWIDYATRVEIKGLHHLQNIFFFRNSEELQVSSLTEH